MSKEMYYYYDVECMQDIIDIASKHNIQRWADGRDIQYYNPFLEHHGKIGIEVEIDFIRWNMDNENYNGRYPIDEAHKIKYVSVARKLEDFLEIL